jgi:sodium transport system permease protein
VKAALRRIWIVFRKEGIDNLRDRRSVASSLLTPVIMPIFLIAMIMVIGQTLMQEIVEKPLDLPVIGQEKAPGLIAYLKEYNVNILDAPADPSAAIREGEVNVVLEITDDYGAALREGRPAPIKIYLDSTRQSASPYIERLNTLLSGYESTIGALRLYARGVDPNVMNAISVERMDIATPQSNAVLFLNMLPFLVVMTVFVGGMYVVIDTTAGERERGSLEPLLINPVARRDFVLGKLLASLPFAVACLALTLLLFGLGFNLIPLENFIHVRMNIAPLVLLNIFWISLPVVLLASTLQMVVASFTRSFKEAQTYLPFLPLVAGMPGAFLAFMPVKATLWVAALPIFGQSVMMSQLLRGETIPLLNVLVSVLVTLCVTLALVVLAVFLYKREGIMFGAK